MMKMKIMMLMITNMTLKQGDDHNEHHLQALNVFIDVFADFFVLFVCLFGCNDDIRRASFSLVIPVDNR